MGLFDKLKRAFTKENGETPIEVEESVERTGQEYEDGLSDEAPLSTEMATTSPDSELSSEEIESQMPPLETETMTELTEETVGQEQSEEASHPEGRMPEAVAVEETLEVEATKASEPLIEEVTVQEKYDKGLAKTRKTFKERMNELFANFRSVDEDFFEEVEETLIGADVGFETSMKIADELRQEVKLRNVKKPAAVQNLIIEKLVDLYEAEGVGEVNALNLQPNGLTVMLFVGVNGVGKTTSIGKLAYEYKQAGKKVLLAAADTFRAGAIDQLVVWGERADVEVIRGKAGGDPAAVVFDAMVKAKEKQADILLVDTAGRLQNKAHLMQELDKIKRIIQREEPNAPHEVLLVLDATTGQNAMSQAKQFKETTDVTGLVLTKLDGTAKGGIVLAIRNELHLPVKLVGLGEGIEDLEIFNPNDFVIGLFKGLLEEE